MALVVANRVQETSTTSGTGTLSLAGAISGYRTFVSGVGSGNTTYYTLYDSTAFVWEVGLGTVTSGATSTLSRTTVLSNSSGTTSPISLAGNAITVWCDYPAEKAIYTDASGNTTLGAALNVTGTTTLATSLNGVAYLTSGVVSAYTTSGSGTVVALTTSPSFTTPLLGTPTSGTLSNCTVDGTNGVGYINIPQNAQTGAYSLVASDAGKHIFHAAGAAAATYTIPANGSVPYIIGTALTFVNLSTNAVTIAITTDTMYLAGAGTTGNRTLGTYGTATALKITSTAWIISGAGLS